MKTDTCKCQVDTFGRTTGENQFALGSSEKFEHLSFSLFKDACCEPARLMGDTAGVCILTDHHWNHSIDNTRIDCGSRMVVKVDFLGFDRVSLEQSRHVNLLVKNIGVLPQATLNIAFLKRKSNPFGNRTSRIARLANGHGQHNPTWGVAPGYDEYRLWRKNRVSHLGHRTSRPVRLANGHAHHNLIPGALPQATMNIAVGEKNRVSHWAIEHHDRFDWPTAKHTITRFLGRCPRLR